MWENIQEYVSVDTMDNDADKIKLDEKKIVSDAEKIARQIKSWDRHEFQKEVKNTVSDLNNDINKKIEWLDKNDLWKNEEKIDSIIKELVLDLNKSINQYIKSLDVTDLWVELDEIEDKWNKNLSDFVNAIKYYEHKNKKETVKTKSEQELDELLKQRKWIKKDWILRYAFNNLF